MHILVSDEHTMIYMYTYFQQSNILYREYKYLKI